MKITIVAVGQKIPAWAQSGVDEYLKRFPRDWRVELKTVKTEQRTSAQSAAANMRSERQRIEAIIKTTSQRPYLIALDEHGTRQTTQQMASSLQKIEQEGQDLILVIGGPDGLDADFKKNAAALWRLSDLTLPHAMVRLILAEQLYRSWSILANHPYHRE